MGADGGKHQSAGSRRTGRHSTERRSARGSLIMVLAGLTTILGIIGLMATSAAAQTGSATIEVVNPDSDWDKPINVYPVTQDGLRDETPIITATSPSVTVPPGCWVAASPVSQFPLTFVATDDSRPYFTPPGSNVPYQDALRLPGGRGNLRS